MLKMHKITQFSKAKSWLWTLPVRNFHSYKFTLGHNEKFSVFRNKLMVNNQFYQFARKTKVDKDEEEEIKKEALRVSLYMK